MAGIANLLVNIVIIGLLGVTIAYCYTLNRRIRILQDSKSELAQLLRHFDESTMRASESIIALQTASKKIGENIQQRIEKANYLVDDLAHMIERGNKIVNQLEASMAINRAKSRAQENGVDHEIMEAPAPKPAAKPMPMAERAFEKPQATSREKTVASLEAVLERVSNRGKPPVMEEPRRAPGQPRVPSKMEQELLEILKAGVKG